LTDDTETQPFQQSMTLELRLQLSGQSQCDEDIKSDIPPAPLKL